MPNAGIMASSVVTSGITVATSSTEIGTAIGATDTNTIPSPTGVTVGDLLVGWACLDSSAAAITAIAGWTLLNTGTISGIQLKAWARIADGTATDTLVVGAPSGGTQASDYCAAVLRITGHTVVAIGTDIRTAVQNGTSATPQPPPIAGGASGTRLWLVGAVVDRSVAETITAMPTSYTQVVNLVSSAEATSVVMAVAQRTTTDHTPSTFTASASRPWATITLALP